MDPKRTQINFCHFSERLKQILKTSHKQIKTNL
jgi:hypothetical protein